MPRRLDLTGQKFWKLTAIEYVGNRKWLWQCECGRKTIADGRQVRRGEIKSCGCMIREYHERRNNAGCKKNKYYRLWHGIKTRCFCKTDMHYPAYGGRGITMAKEWVTDFWAFYEYISKMPHFEEEGYSIDRIDNNGDYAPGNVRWADGKQQARNRRNNKLISAFGKKKTCAAWAEEYGVNYYTLWSRVFEHGWDAEKAITTPAKT